MRFLGFGVAWCAATSAYAALGFPDYVRFPPQIQSTAEQTLIKEDLGEAEFAVDKTGATRVAKRGVHYARWFVYTPAAGEPAPGYYNGTEDRIFKAMTAAFAKDGWQTVFVEEGKSYFSMRLNKPGKEVWAAVKMDAPQAQVNLELIETGVAANALVLTPPAASPEKWGEQDDFPFLTPFPGSTRKGVGHADGPLDVSEPGKSGSEPMLVGSGVDHRSYQGPSTLSKLQFVRDYREALVKAGWKLLYPADEKSMDNYSGLAAHYNQNGRDVWVKLTYEYGASLGFSVADVGREDWGTKLDKDCRLPLYGVFLTSTSQPSRPNQSQC